MCARWVQSQAWLLEGGQGLWQLPCLQQLPPQLPSLPDKEVRGVRNDIHHMMMLSHIADTEGLQFRR